MGEPNPTVEFEPPQVEVLGTATKQETMTLDEAQKITGFNIMTPKSVPDGFDLRDVTAVIRDTGGSDEVQLHYVRGEEMYTINELDLSDKTMGFVQGVDREDTELRNVNIHAKEGKLFLFKDGTNKLIWEMNHILFEIESSLSEEMLIQIAESIKQP